MYNKHTNICPSYYVIYYIMGFKMCYLLYNRIQTIYSAFSPYMTLL